MTTKEQELLDDIIFSHLDSHSDGWTTSYDYGNVIKGLRIAYLKGILEHNIWADSMPNGNEICDEYEKELQELLKNK